MPPDGQPWAADNGCFSRPEDYTDDGYLAWLESVGLVDAARRAALQRRALEQPASASATTTLGRWFCQSPPSSTSFSAPSTSILRRSALAISPPGRSAITPERMEVELFGIELSDGETGRKPGALEEAHGGTLFIDEIASVVSSTMRNSLFASAGNDRPG